jgi:hypothetical protein
MRALHIYAEAQQRQSALKKVMTSCMRDTNVAIPPNDEVASAMAKAVTKYQNITDSTLTRSDEHYIVTLLAVR